MLWLLVVYVLSLVLLIFASLYTIDDFTFETTDVRTLDNLRRAFTQRDVLDVVLRSVLVAPGGHRRVPRDRPADGVLHRQGRQALGATGADRVVLLPLWAGYLVKGYAWKALLRPAGEGARRRVPAIGVRVHARASAWPPSS